MEHAVRMSGRIDFTSQDYLRNPAPAIERLRAAGPVVEVRFPIVGKTWITTTELAASCVLKDAHTFTLRKDDGTTVGMLWWMPGIFRALANNMLITDEPDHARLRSIVDEAFRRRAILEMQPRSPLPRRSPGSYLRMAVRPIWSPATHANCPFR